MRYTRALLAACALTSSTSAPVFADASPLVFGRGLRPPTAQEQAWLDANQLVTDRVLPNRRSLERLNDERARRGLPVLSEAAVQLAADGAEVSGHYRTPSLAPLEPRLLSPTDVGGAAPPPLPTTADNSATIWFPPIRSQGSLGSCVAFSQTYYTFTYLVAQALNRDVTSNSINSDKFSPKFIYNLSNGGTDTGMWTAFPVLKSFGAPSWDVWPYDGNYKAMPQAAAVWRNALNFRAELVASVPHPDDVSVITNLKQLIANGTLLNFTTNITHHLYGQLKDDPSTPLDDGTVNQQVVRAQGLGTDDHEMTIVGYDDNVWTDLNGNGVVDLGEKGAFKIANSWGAGWGNAGFVWFAYDAVRTTTLVTGGPATRFPAINSLVWMRLRAVGDTPKLLAELTLNAASRPQLALSLGVDSPAVTTPATSSWISSWSIGAYNIGALGFDGTTNPVDATFAFDFTGQVLDHAPHRWFAIVQDTAAGAPTTISSYRLTDADGGLLAPFTGSADGGLPQTVDGAKLIAWADYQLPAGINVAPVVNPAATFWVNATIGTPLTFTLAANAFIDADGDALTWSASDLPAGLTFTPATRTVSGTPATLGYFVGLVSVDDGHSHATSTQLSVSVNPVSTNVAPVLVTPIPDQTATAGVPYSYAIPSTTFTDADGDRLTWNAPELPAWLSLDAGTSDSSGGVGQPGKGSSPVLYGTPPSAAVQRINLSVDDGHAHLVGTSFTLTVLASATNVPPVLAQAMPDLAATVGVAFAQVIPAGTFTDADGDPLSWIASGLPAGLGFDGATRTISGTPATAGASVVTVLVNDGHGHSTPGTFTLTVSTPNVAPVVAATIGNQAASQGVAYTYTIPSGTFTDADGDTLTWTVAGLPAGLSFDAATHVISGTPTTLEAPVVTVSVGDGHSHTASTTFTLSVSGNVPPVVSAAPGSQRATAGLLYAYVVPAGTFTDADGDPLTWSASGLPAGLVFDTANRRISGTPLAIGSSVISLSVDDGHGHSVSTSFTLVVSGTNVAPVVAMAPGDQTATVGVAYTYLLPAGIFADADGDVLTWSASGLPGGLSFDAVSRTILGTPVVQDTWVVTVSVDDAHGHTASTTFTLLVLRPGEVAPVLATPLADQLAIVGAPFTYTVPAGTFSDADGDPLTWTATSLPAWLSFDVATHTFSGTPTVAEHETITVSVTDPSRVRASGSFGLTVRAAVGGVLGGCSAAGGSPELGWAVLGVLVVWRSRRRRT